jgi:hypothetical protein
MKEAVSGGSSVATTGVTKVGGSTQFTSLAVPDTFKPSAPAAVAPSAAPTSFIGPIPATATRTDTGYTTASGTTVNPTAQTSMAASAPAAATSSAPANKPSIIDNVLAAPSQFANTVISGVTRGFGVSSAQRAAGITPPKAAKLSTKEASDITKTTAAELTGIPAAKRVVTGTSTAVRGSTTPVFGNKELGKVLGSKQFGTALDVASALPFAGGTFKGAAKLGALGKTAKAVGAADAALKGGKLVATKTAGKAAVPAALAMLAASPAGHALEIGKATSAITQSAKAGNTAKALDTFVPKAAKAASKESSSIPKSVENAPKKVSSTGFSEGTKTKTATAVATGKVASSIVNVGKAGTSTNTAVKAPAYNKAAVDYQAQAKENKINNFNNEVNKVKDSNTSGKEHLNQLQGLKGKPGDIDIVKTKILNPDTQNPDIHQAVVNYPYVNPYVKPFDNSSGGEGEGGDKREEPKPKEEKPGKKRRIPHIKVKGDGRQWRPSSIV